MTTRKLIVLFLLMAGLTAAAYADKSSGATYDLYDNTNNAGGQRSDGSTYTLFNANGDAVGNEMTGNNYILIPGLFGLFTGAASQAAVVGQPDNGYIKSIYLYKDASDHVWIKWGYKNASVTGAMIYSLNQNEFTREAATWQQVYGNDAQTFNQYDFGVDDYNNKYYVVTPYLNHNLIDKTKVFTASTTGEYLARDASNIPYTSWPVGKIVLKFTAGEAKFIGWQILPTDSTGFLSTLQPVTKQAGFQIGNLLYNNNGLIRIDCAAGTWNLDIPIEAYSGGWLTSDNAGNYSFTGALINGENDKNMILGSDIYAYKFPVTADKTRLQLSAPGFENNEWLLVNQNGLVRYSYDGSTGKWDGDFKIPVGNCIWYTAASAGKKLQTVP